MSPTFAGKTQKSCQKTHVHGLMLADIRKLQEMKNIWIEKQIAKFIRSKCGALEGNTKKTCTFLQPVGIPTGRESK